MAKEDWMIFTKQSKSWDIKNEVSNVVLLGKIQFDKQFMITRQTRKASGQKKVFSVI